jgi:UDP-glucose 4-epimerase
VRGTILAAERDAAIGTVLNIGSAEEITIWDLAGLVNEVSGSRSEIVLEPYESYYGAGFEDTRRRVPDVQRARELLGFTATVPLRSGLDMTIDWCRRNYQLAEAVT